MAFNVPEAYRVKKGDYATQVSDGNNGIFVVPSMGSSVRLHYQCIASDSRHEQSDFKDKDILWEHVSIVPIWISHTGKTREEERTPTWAEMCYLKELFWDDPEDVVLQFHPPESEYVNTHRHCLHLWRAVDKDGQPIPVPRPTPAMVGQLPTKKEPVATDERK
jgi:hypothetical protein